MPTEPEIRKGSFNPGVMIDGQASIEAAASSVAMWLRFNTEGVVEWGEFVSHLDEALAEPDFTEQVLNIFADKIAETMPDEEPPKW